MGYVLVKGGSEAIRNANRVVNLIRSRDSEPLNTSQLKGRMRIAVDQAMGEGSLYSPDVAALALQQSDGDIIEASFKIRAYRTTLPRIGYSETQDTKDMFVLRRISSAFKDIPGGQILGPTIDYTQRFIDFIGTQEDVDEFEHQTEDVEVPKFRKIVDMMREEGVIEDVNNEPEDEPYDVTKDPLLIPASRSARLQTLARGETGAMMMFAYSILRGFGASHPTIAELRVGYIPLRIKHPYTGNTVTVGDVMVTESECINSGIGSGTSECLTEDNRFAIGYGLVMGQNERKAISMGMLDAAMNTSEPKAPAEDEEFVLYHIDGVDGMGFVEHLKLPHYVSFQSSLDRVRSAQKKTVVKEVKNE
ncbi:MAG: alpha-D-ribose 1-methylphosphonate 5-triphosphate synthase subunit PhnI [Methanolobus sp.]|nr:alpha-D-ribose 1-methylphosphonate 5-triphosphate synthase subunit PhnI [Methanolobus sp.]